MNRNIALFIMRLWRYLSAVQSNNWFRLSIVSYSVIALSTKSIDAHYLPSHAHSYGARVAVVVDRLDARSVHRRHAVAAGDRVSVVGLERWPVGAVPVRHAVFGNAIY